LPRLGAFDRIRSADAPEYASQRRLTSSSRFFAADESEQVGADLVPVSGAQAVRRTLVNLQLRAPESTAAMYGDLQGIAGSPLREIDALDKPLLESSTS
jgi:hypothetical protein